MGLPRINGEVAKLWKDVEIRWTPQGKAVCSLPLLFVKRVKNRDTGEWEDAGQLWVRGTVWDQMAENCANSLAKGDQVLVSGELSQREYDRDDGSKGTSLELRVWEIGASLRFNEVKVARAERGSQQKQQAPVDDPWAAKGVDDEIPF